MEDFGSDERREKDGRLWRIGGALEVRWIQRGTQAGLSITSAIPPVFEAYATLEHPGTGTREPMTSFDEWDWHVSAVLDILTRGIAAQPWWLGYLDTGIGAETVFYDVPKVALYNGDYVLVEAGPDQAATWRPRESWKGPLPDLMFPTDRSWLFSTLWDDDWSCIGGTSQLVDDLIDHPLLRGRAHRVELSMADATPPGHTAI